MNLPDRVDRPGQENFSAARMMGDCLRDAMVKNDDFYLFSPDETGSNRLDEVFNVTARAWGREVLPWDRNLAKDGRVVELLSENVLFSVLAGHVLSGGSGALTSYEGFFPIVSSQVDQHMKFLKQAQETGWRPKYKALNLLSTSCWQRQDHNGYTHQNPSLISSLLVKPENLVNCFFPVDDVAAAAAWEYMMRSEDVVNLTTFNKTAEPRWIDIRHARFQLANGGMSVFEFASDAEPEMILMGAGDIASKELLRARQIVKWELPELRLRFVGVGALSYGAIGTTENKLGRVQFEEICGTDLPILVNFHGYAETMRGILGRYGAFDRAEVRGYSDEGSTTTPLDELMRNGCDRYSLAMAIFAKFGRRDLVEKYRRVMADATTQAELYGMDAGL